MALDKGILQEKAKAVFDSVLTTPELFTDKSASSALADDYNTLRKLAIETLPDELRAAMPPEAGAGTKTFQSFGEIAIYSKQIFELLRTQ